MASQFGQIDCTDNLLILISAIIASGSSIAIKNLVAMNLVLDGLTNVFIPAVNHAFRFLRKIELHYEDQDNETIDGSLIRLSKALDSRHGGELQLRILIGSSYSFDQKEYTRRCVSENEGENEASQLHPGNVLHLARLTHAELFPRFGLLSDFRQRFTEPKKFCFLELRPEWSSEELTGKQIIERFPSLVHEQQAPAIEKYLCFRGREEWARTESGKRYAQDSPPLA